MTKTLFAAMSGVGFGLVLAASGYHFYMHSCCHRTAAPAVMRVEVRPAHPCTAAPRVVTVDGQPGSDSAPSAMPSAELDALADDTLDKARRLARTDPLQARNLCRKTMLLYQNNPRNARVRTAFKLLNTIPRPQDDEE